MTSNPLSKKCTRCKKCLPFEDFGVEKAKKDGRKPRCRQCMKITRKEQYNKEKRVAATRRWQMANPQKHKAQLRRYRVQIKCTFIEGYGGKCTCCGENQIEFLTMEHINGGGREHRKKRGSGGAYRDAITRGFPPEYTVLCMNCNHARKDGRECPHQAVIANATKN